MKRRLAILALVVLVPGGIAFLVLYNSRTFWLRRIAKKWGARNPEANEPETFATMDLFTLRRIYREGRPSWNT